MLRQETHYCLAVADLWVFDAYFCDLSPVNDVSQRTVGSVVAAREVVYIATTLCALFACPVFLLLDIGTVWREAETTTARVFRIAVYLVCNYALSHCVTH
jgi:hypothetical protein